MANDFRASQIQTGKIIVTGSLEKLAIYSITTPGATSNNGTITDTTLNGQLQQKDTFVFVSGAINSKNTNTKGVSVFGGDVHVSGNLSIDKNLTANQGVVFLPTIITGGTYFVTNNNYIIGVEANSSSTIIMPASPKLGQVFMIKDALGNSDIYNININGNGKLIDGDIIINIRTKYESIQIINFGTYWSIV